MEDSIRIYLLSFLVGLVSLVLYVIFLAPRYILKLFICFKVLFSKFRWKRYINLGKDLWAAYLERGDISTTNASVLLVHGFSGSSSDFVGLLKTIPENYHVVAVDLLNHGDSSVVIDRNVLVEDMVNFLKKFVEKLGFNKRKFHIVAFSYGTSVCSQYVSLYPDNVASLVLCAPPHFLDLSGEPEGKFTSRDQFLISYKKFHGSKYQRPSAVVVQALVDILNSSYEKLQRVKNGQRGFKFTKDMLNSININTLLVWGDADQVCLFKGIDHFKKNIPNCECYVIKDGGHMMFETYLEETSKAINEWLSCHGNQLMTSQ